MQFSLAETRVLLLKTEASDYRPPDPDEGPDEEPYKLGFELVKPDDTLRQFAVIFDCRVRSPQLHYFEVKYLARFETDLEVSEEFMQSHYAGMNAPAIAYPYLRAFVGQALLLSGFKPITLPTVNFQEVFNKKRQSDGADISKAK